MEPNNKLGATPIRPLLFSDRIAGALTREPELQELCREYLSVNLVFCWASFCKPTANGCCRQWGTRCCP